MKTLSAGFAIGLVCATFAAAPAWSTSDHPEFVHVQYNPPQVRDRDAFPDQRQDNYSDQRRDTYDRDSRGDNYNDRNSRGGQKWRPGQVIPGQFLGRVVADWEERGLSRPPNDHRWVRVGEQFILVRGKDRMIARVLNFN